RLFHRILIDLGAEHVPYLMPTSGANGYDQVTIGPTDRVLQPGDLLFVDVGATWRGYFCDFDRNFAIERTTDELRDAETRVFAATEAGIKAVRPGRTTSDIWRAMADVLGSDGQVTTPIGRMGHGLGLDITEPPSIAPGDDTVLEERTVLTIEPSLL